MIYYKNIPLRIDERKTARRNAKRFFLGRSDETIWIPNEYIDENDKIKKDVNIDFVFEAPSNYNKIIKLGMKFG